MQIKTISDKVGITRLSLEWVFIYLNIGGVEGEVLSVPEHLAVFSGGCCVLNPHVDRISRHRYNEPASPRFRLGC